MADNKSAAKSQKLEREYVIPLRRHWVNVARYDRTSKAIKAIKIFIAKHMKVEDRDVRNVKLDVYFNNEMWFRGRRNPPAKVKVKAVKEGNIVHVSFVETPQHVKFLKARHDKRHVVGEETKPSKEVKEEKPTETAEEKKAEQEKEKSVAEQAMKEAKVAAKTEKHVTKPEKAQRPQRMALQK